FDYSRLTHTEIEIIGKFIHRFLSTRELANLLIRCGMSEEECKEIDLKLVQVELNKTKGFIRNGSYAGMELSFRTEKYISTAIQHTIKKALENKFAEQRIKCFSYGRGEIGLRLEIYSMSVVLACTTID